MIPARYQTPAIVILAALAFILTAIALGAANPATYTAAMNSLKIFALARPFGDIAESLRTLDCARRGFDVYAANPCGILFNYPPAWLLLAPTGLGLHDSYWLGGVMAVAMVLSLAILFIGVPLGQAWVAVLLLLCPPSLLMLERANLDIACFVLLLAGGFLLDRTARMTGLAAGLLCTLATALKLYPIAAAALALVPRRQFRIAGLTVLIAGLLVLTPMLPRLQTVSDRAAWFGIVMNYGYLAGFWRMQAYLHNDGNYIVLGTAPLINASFILAARLTVLAAMLVAAVLAFTGRKRGWLPALPEGRRAAWYVMGAGVFLCTFLLALNWMHRLIFLALCAPSILHWLSVQKRPMLSFPGILLATILAQLYLERFYHHTWGLEHVASWILFTLFTAHFMALMLDTVRDYRASRIHGLAFFTENITGNSGG